MSERRERTATEREAARLERERRRAGHKGAAPREATAPPMPLDLPREATAPPMPVEPVEQAVEPPMPVEPVEQADEPPMPVEPVDEPEHPAGTRRVSRIHRVSRVHRVRSSRRPTGKTDLRRRSRLRGRERTGHSRAGRMLALVALLLVAAVIWFLVELFQPFHASAHGSLTVTIPAHTSSSQVGDLLAHDGVVASSFFFELRATLSGDRSSLRPGTYQLKLDMSYGAALTKLSTPPPAAKVTELTITEGRTRQRVSALLAAQGVAGNYLAATRRSRLLDPRRYGAPHDTSSLEGFLFPSTYQLRDPVSIHALVADQLRTFQQRFATVNLGYTRRKHLTPYDVLIIASLVEGESRTEHDRPLVASVIYNRLARGMLLQIDATTRFATGNYTRPLTVSQLHSPSPYNTRVHTGLPPAPIDNPGLASIEAASHPARTNYLFFVVKPCGNGEQAFASSYATFLAHQQQYQAARNKRGGRSPTNC